MREGGGAEKEKRECTWDAEDDDVLDDDLHAGRFFSDRLSIVSMWKRFSIAGKMSLFFLTSAWVTHGRGMFLSTSSMTRAVLHGSRSSERRGEKKRSPENRESEWHNYFFIGIIGSCRSRSRFQEIVSTARWIPCSRPRSSIVEWRVRNRAARILSLFFARAEGWKYTYIAGAWWIITGWRDRVAGPDRQAQIARLLNSRLLLRKRPARGGLLHFLIRVSTRCGNINGIHDERSKGEKFISV